MFRSKEALYKALEELKLCPGAGVKEASSYVDISGVKHSAAWLNVPVTATRRGRVYPFAELVEYEDGQITVASDYRIKFQDFPAYRELLLRAGYKSYAIEANGTFFNLVAGTDY
jgi:hypothetical protein